MTGDEIQKVAAEAALKLPLAELSYPFGDDINAFKIMDKIFMLSFEHQGRKLVNLKINPDESEMLRDTYSSIRVGYHMNKKHWISVYAGEQITPDLVQDLVEASYYLITAKLTKKQKQALAIHTAAEK